MQLISYKESFNSKLSLPVFRDLSFIDLERDEN